MDFRGFDGTEAAGRTRSWSDGVEAVADWLDGRDIEALHVRFAFVDQRKRALRTIEVEAFARHPGLARLAISHLAGIGSDSYQLIFRASDRSCRIYFYGHAESPEAEFQWDDCAMFRTRADNIGRLSTMLKRWLCDLSKPSEMAGAFPELEIEPVARYYEQGCPIEGEFLVSWDRIETFYEDPPNRSFGEPALALIAEIRKAGFDRTLRAGQSLWTLIVSRSRRHGLREGQAYVAFQFYRTSMNIIDFHGGTEERFPVPRIALEARVELVLDRLSIEPID